jgi:hypothetical protein
MIPVADDVLRDREVVRGIINAVITEVVDRVGPEQRIILERMRSDRTFRMCDPTTEM